MTNDQFVKSFAERCKAAMDLREDSWDCLNERYNLSIRDTVAQVFGDDPMGYVAFLTIHSHWNQIEDWSNNPYFLESVRMNLKV